MSTAANAHELCILQEQVCSTGRHLASSHASRTFRLSLWGPLMLTVAGGPNPPASSKSSENMLGA